MHRERPFYKDLVGYMSSGPIVAAILEKDNAVEDFRKADRRYRIPPKPSGNHRNLFAKSIQRNTVHGSDSDENAAIEGNCSGTERFDRSSAYDLFDDFSSCLTVQELNYFSQDWKQLPDAGPRVQGNKTLRRGHGRPVVRLAIAGPIKTGH